MDAAYTVVIGLKIEPPPGSSARDSNHSDKGFGRAERTIGLPRCLEARTSQRLHTQLKDVLWDLHSRTDPAARFSFL